MKGQRVVLCIQDGSDLDYSTLAQCEGLGVIGTNQTEAQSRRLHLHSTFAVAPNIQQLDSVSHILMPQFSELAILPCILWQKEPESKGPSTSLACSH